MSSILERVLMSPTNDERLTSICDTLRAIRPMNVDYRLAPEHRFPAAHDDCLRATRWAARALHRDVVLIGDSVGGNLSLSVGAQLIGDAEVTVRGIVSISPLTDFTLSSPSLTTRRARDPFTYLSLIHI